MERHGPGGYFCIINSIDMQTKQTVTIIGNTRELGSFMAMRLAPGNFRLLLCADNHEMGEKVLEEIKLINPLADVEFAGCPFDASWESDIIIVAAPPEEYEQITERIRSVANQKIVVSLASINDQASKNPIAEASSLVEVLQKGLPNSKIIRVVISGFQGDINTQSGTVDQIDALLAGDDQPALETVGHMLRAANLSAVIIGGLASRLTLIRR